MSTNLDESHNSSSIPIIRRMPEHRSYDKKIQISIDHLRFSLYDLTPSTLKRWVKPYNKSNRNVFDHQLVPNIPSKNTDDAAPNNETLNTSISSQNDEKYDETLEHISCIQFEWILLFIISVIFCIYGMEALQIEFEINALILLPSIVSVFIALFIFGTRKIEDIYFEAVAHFLLITSVSLACVSLFYLDWRPYCIIIFISVLYFVKLNSIYWTIIGLIIAYFIIDWKVNKQRCTSSKSRENKYDLLKPELLINQRLNYTLTQWQKVVNQYSEYANNQYNEQQIDTLFKNIDIPLLLNDFLYLLSRPKFIEKFEFNSCDPQKCKIFHRKYRKYRDRDKYKYKSKDNDEKIIYIEILDKIHCYYCHQMDIIQMQQSENHRYNQLEFKYELQSNNNKLYSFGIEFKYGYDGEEAHYNSIAISPKYSSLKQELTTNPLSTISIDQFNSEYKKALIHFNSEYRKQYHSNISIEHLLALMLYCNFDALQYELSKTYRENNGNDHDNYYQWGKLLKIAVKIHGTKIEKGDIKTFYHGIGDELLLPQYNGNGYGWSGVQIFCPLSTTSSCAVAANFTNNYNGLVIEFGGDAFRCNDTKYFSVQWLSDYSHESEYLFIQNQYGLQINNIINMQNSEQYRDVLDALKMFDAITTGYGTDDETLHCIEKMQHIMNIMICSEMKSQYVGQIFETFCKNKKLMVLDYNKFKYKYPILFNRLFVSECDEKDECEIKAESIFTLFSGLDTLNVNFCDKYISMSSLESLIQRFYVSSLNTMELWNVRFSDDCDGDKLYGILQIYQRQCRTIKMVITKRKGSYHLCFKRRIFDGSVVQLSQNGN